jgi:hypothetical protein
LTWQEVLGLSLLILVIIVIWFINIRWTIRFWHKEILKKRIYLNSKSPIQTTQNNQKSDNKEYNYMGLNPLNKKDYTQNNKSKKPKYDSGFYSPIKVRSIIIRHVNRIIGRSNK